jgi:hypothetical protein
LVLGIAGNFPLNKTWYWLGKGEVGIQIGVIGRAAVPSPVTGIHSELHEVCQPPDLLCPCRLLGKVRNSSRSTGPALFETRYALMKVKWVISSSGIVMDVLGHVRIENRKGSGVGWIPSPSWDFAVLDSSEFIVLLPQTSLKDFGCS